VSNEESTQPAFILVDGPFRSGKTAFLEAISDRKVISAEPPSARFPRGNPLDYGLIRLDDGSAVYLLGTASGLHFDPVQELPHLPMSLMGMVLMVDSTKTMTFEEAKVKLQRYLKHFSAPCVVAASGQDLPGALMPGDVRAALQIPASIPVVPCVANDTESVRSVLIALLHVVIDRLEMEGRSDE
jgi:signal recognition particle receptor subunit beta